ncbi:MAG TPA: acyl carrier protein [Candidatus Angelobacter sp.]|jgi:acyl carrier protein|nr:acyl carrier protein [Candidatus Angelobacter sp.]
MNIASEILSYIRTQLSADVAHIDLDCNLWTEGYLDSTAILELILWLESSYNITVQNEELTPENFATLRNIEEFVQRSMARAVSDTLPARA